MRLTVRMKPSGHDGAHQVAGDHDALAVQAVEHHAGQRPASIAGMARESITPLTTMPDLVVASARLKTAMLLKWSPISLTTWPIQVLR